MDTWQAVERFGLPVVMLLLLALFITKTLWPFLVKRIEAAEAQSLGQLALTQKHLELSLQAAQVMAKDFTEALKRRDELLADLNKIVAQGFARSERRNDVLDKGDLR